MASTTNYGWTLPTVGGDTDAWGGELNNDLVGIDSTVFSVSGVANAAQTTANTAQTTANAALPRAGGTLTGALTPSQTAGIVGTTAANNANAGSIGEYVSVDQLTNVSLVTATPKTVTSISLTAGDWDVEGWVNMTFSAGGTQAISSVSTTTNAIAGGMTGWQGACQVAGTGMGSASLPTGRVRILIAATTVIYLTGQGVFASGTCNAQGSIIARRVR